MPAEAAFDRARRVRLIWSAAAMLVTATVAFLVWPRPIEVDVVRADRGMVRVEIVDEGRTRMHDVYVLSAPVSGRVLRVEVEPGDAVEAGAVVARMARAAAGFLDTRSDLQARAALSAAEANLRAAAAQAVLAERELARARELAAAKLVAVAAIDEAQARAAAAVAAREAADADVARARSALLSPERVAGGMVPVRAPVAGRVLRVPQQSESVIAPGTPLVEIGDPSRIEVVAEFLSQDAVRMRPGAAATIENWGGPPLAARVDRIEPVARTKVSALGVEEQRTNVVLELLAPDAASRLGHDYRVDARVVIVENENMLRVPLGALFRVGERWSVFTVEQGRARLTAVEVGDADGRYRVVSAGLEEGDEVIEFPSSSVVDGVRVVGRRVVGAPAPVPTGSAAAPSTQRP
jgi:HlyD family secretion protein